MSFFTDTFSRQWEININVGTIKKVREMCKVNLYEIMETGENSLSERISNDPVLLVDVIYAICKSQADSKNIDCENFMNGFTGDTIEEAADALLESIVFFFPGAKRKLMQEALREMRKEKAKASREVEEMIQTGLLRKALAEEKSKESSTDAPVSAV